MSCRRSRRETGDGRHAGEEEKKKKAQCPQVRDVRAHSRATTYVFVLYAFYVFSCSSCPQPLTRSTPAYAHARCAPHAAHARTRALRARGFLCGPPRAALLCESHSYSVSYKCLRRIQVHRTSYKVHMYIVHTAKPTSHSSSSGALGGSRVVLQVCTCTMYYVQGIKGIRVYLRSTMCIHHST